MFLIQFKLGGVLFEKKNQNGYSSDQNIKKCPVATVCVMVSGVGLVIVDYKLAQLS